MTTKTISEFSDEELRTISAEFETAQPSLILQWAVETFNDKFALATGFGVEGCLLISLLAEIDTRARIFYLDTDVLFPETYALRDELQHRYGVKIERRAASLTLERQSEIYGADLWESDPDKCCNLRKVEPLRNVLDGLQGWATAVRRDQSPTRAAAGIVERDKKFGLIKINPLADWTRKEVWRYVVANQVPYNKLYDQGFRSIGCIHCTSRTGANEDERAGRWRGRAKTECGLHQ